MRNVVNFSGYARSKLSNSLLPQASLSSFAGKFEFEMEGCLSYIFAIKQAIA